MKAQLDKKTIKNTHDEGRQGLFFSSIVERNLGLRSVVYLRFSRKLVTMLMTTDHISSQYERSVRKRLGQLSQSGQSKRPSLEREYVARAGPVHLWALSKKCFGWPASQWITSDYIYRSKDHMALLMGQNLKLNTSDTRALCSKINSHIKYQYHGRKQYLYQIRITNTSLNITQNLIGTELVVSNITTLYSFFCLNALFRKVLNGINRVAQSEFGHYIQ